MPFFPCCYIKGKPSNSKNFQFYAKTFHSLAPFERRHTKKKRRRNHFLQLTFELILKFHIKLYVGYDKRATKYSANRCWSENEWNVYAHPLTGIKRWKSAKKWLELDFTVISFKRGYGDETAAKHKTSLFYTCVEQNYIYDGLMWPESQEKHRNLRANESGKMEERVREWQGKTV